jgi:hypothetical protein
VILDIFPNQFDYDRGAIGWNMFGNGADSHSVYIRGYLRKTSNTVIF